MTDKIEWPIGEPIETDNESFTATILHIDDADCMSGFITNKKGATFVRAWFNDGKPCGIDNGPNLIPPKPKPRTIDVWIDWARNTAFDGVYPGSTKHTITHPDDLPPPITREDVNRAVKPGLVSQRDIVDAMMALLDERGTES